MSMNIFFSNNVGALAGKLAEYVAHQASDSLLPEPTRIIVPNSNLAKWLKITIAETNGIAMNVEFPYLESGLWDMVKTLAGSEYKQTKPLDTALLQRAIAAQLAGLCANKADSVFTKYCLKESGDESAGTIPSGEDPVRRIWQLAGRLATLFREYELHRGIYMADSGDRDMIDAWLKGKTGLTDGEDETPTRQAQRKLYQSLFAETEADAIFPGRMSLPTLARKVFPKNAPEKPIDLGSIHIFGMSQVSPFHCWLLYQLADVAEITLYHFNICREFWEDVQTPSEQRWEKIRNVGTTDIDGEVELQLTIENPLLGMWGKAGREGVKLLADLDDGSGRCQVEWLNESEELTPATVLEAVHHGIACRTSDLTKIDQDFSLQIAGCPGIYREVQTVYNSILTNMQADKKNGLKLTDIAVLVPDMATYKPALLSVFQSGGGIPFNLSDSSADTDSVYGKGLLALLDLAGSRFTRKQLFAVLSNPCVMAAFGISNDELDTWAQWADELGVFHSFGEHHRVEQGLSEDKRYTWQQGLQRLRLGRIMSEERDTDGGEPVWPLPFEGMETGSRTADLFSLSIERLYHDIWHLQGTKKTVQEWMDCLEDLMDSYLGIPRDLVPETHVRRKLRESLQAWAGETDTECFSVFLKKSGLEDEKLSLAWVKQFIAESLVGIPSGIGTYLTQGVTIASLLPMRPVPFEIVYVMGMTEGQFPGNKDQATLDLRNQSRFVGDVSRPEAGRYLFFETLMTVQKKLYLTYDRFDAKKDEEKFPCSVVQQLKTFLNQHVLEEEFKEAKMPLNSHDSTFLTGGGEKSYTDLMQQWGFSERALGYLLAAKKEKNPKNKTAQSLKAKLKKELTAIRDTSPTSRRGKLAARILSLPDISPLGDTTTTDDTAGTDSEMIPDKVDIDIKDLVSFLKDPAKAILEKRFRLYDDDETGEAEVAENEPLQSEFLAGGNLKESCLTEVFFSDAKSLDTAKQTLQEVLDAHFKVRRIKSSGPDTAFATLEKGRLMTDMEPQLEYLWPLKEEYPEYVRNVVMGNATLDDGEPGLELPATVIDVSTNTQAAISGRLNIGMTDATYENRLNGSVVISGFKAADSGFIPHQLLHPLLFFMAVKAGQSESEDLEITLRASFCEGKKKPTNNEVTLGASQCKDYLKSLIADYLTCRQLAALPYKVITDKKVGIISGGEIADNTTKTDIECLIEKEREENSNPHGRKKWYLNDMHKLCWDDMTVPEDFRTICERRLIPLVQLVTPPVNTGNGEGN